METANIKFNGGIWSEVLKGRYDLGNYQSASRTCENFIPNRYGQVEKRSGTKHLGYAKEDDRVCVLHPFQYSVNTKFILEFGHEYIRFWSNDLLVPHATGETWVSGDLYNAGDIVENAGTSYLVLKKSSATNINNTNVFKPLPSDGTLEVETPYQEDELYELQIRAVNDVVYIVHPNHPVGKLIRFADDRWVYIVADLNLPFVDPDADPTEVTITASDVTGSITLTASEDLFDDSYVGSTLRLQHIEEGNIYTFGSTGSPAAVPEFVPTNGYNVTDNTYQTPTSEKRYLFRCTNAYDPSTTWVGGTYAINDLVTHAGLVYICTDPHISSDDPTVNTADWDLVTEPDDAPFYFEEGMNRVTVTVSDEWSFRTRGIWNGVWSLQRSIDGGTTFTTIKVLSSSNDQNYLVEENEGGEEVKIRVKQIAIPHNGDAMSGELNVLAGARYGEAAITSVVDGVTANATVTKNINVAGEPSVLWQESGFSPRQGYPRSIALFDNRLIFAGTARKPQGFFYSGINDYENFLATTTLADAPFFIETLADDQSSVQWISAQREIFVGTASLEGILLTRKQDEAQSPENLPIVRWNESMGSAHRGALPMRDSLMCLQRGRTTINMLAYSLERDGYTGEEVSLLCNHLFASGVQQMAHLREPYTGAYTVQEDGTLCHMVYEPKLEVTGWCKFTTQNGSFESVAVLPSSGNENSDEDEVWCVVKREVNGDTKRHIEHFTVGNRAKQEALDTDNLWYVDAGVKATGTDLTSVSGLGHLEGETVCVLADGIKGEYVVSSGVITLSIPADTVIVGLPVVSEFEPLDLEVTYKGGSTYGKRKQLYQSKLMLHKSLGGSIAYDSESYQELIYHTAGEAMDGSIPLKSGYSEVFAEGGHSRQKFWRIKHAEPYPFTLQAVIQSFTMGKH